MQGFKTPWVEASWSTAAVEDLSKEVNTFIPEETTSNAQSSDGIPTQLAKVKPSAGVIDAFLEVERQIRKYLKVTGTVTGTGSNLPRMVSPVTSFRRYADAPDHLKHAVSELAALRNAAAHGVGDISLESALQYTATASRVARELESLIDDTLVAASSDQKA